MRRGRAVPLIAIARDRDRPSASDGDIEHAILRIEAIGDIPGAQSRKISASGDSGNFMLTPGLWGAHDMRGEQD
ncbi:hypothetical protein B8P98_13565 [Klebsiella quasivariicola]|nr:hypothetical protein B8P98_13565 [Klebsiella quasivariicola]